MLVGFRREYRLDFREALATMWHVDVGILIDGLERWSDQDENLAMLVDRLDYWLNSEYRSWITDPDDPEVKRERERRKREGIKPPADPVIFPVAHRPPRVQAELMKRLLEKQKEKETLAVKKDGRRFGSLSDLRKLRGE